MIVPFRSADSVEIDEAPDSRSVKLIDEKADCIWIDQRRLPDRKLRNLILLANAVAWVAIIMFVRYVLLRI